MKKMFVLTKNDFPEAVYSDEALASEHLKHLTEEEDSVPVAERQRRYIYWRLTEVPFNPGTCPE